MTLRDGSCPGVVVWDRVLALHRPKELSVVWKGERNCGSQPQFWDRLPVWLDLLWEIWSSWGKKKHPRNLYHFPFLTLRGICISVLSSIFFKKFAWIFLFFQSSKVLAKKELSYVPVIGWMWYFLEIVFCKRKWEEDRRTVAQSLQNLRDYPENYWVNFNLWKSLQHQNDWEWYLFRVRVMLHRYLE